MHSIIKGIRIGAVAVGVPEKWLSLDEQFGYEGSGIDEKTLKRFKKSTGVEGRYISDAKQTSSDLCFAAAEKILSQKQIDRNKVGVLVYVTQSADYRNPATAMVLHHRLGLGIECLVFDVNLGCSGFVYGLNIVSSLMLQCDAQFGMLMCGDTGGRDKIPDDKSSADTEKILFGDAGSATLLIKDSEAPDMNFLSNSNGNGFKAIIDPWGFYRNPIKIKDVNHMDGVAVFNFSTNEAPLQINELMKMMNTTPDNYDYLVLHQANTLIINQIEKKTGFSKEKNLKAIDRFANTSSSSIPVAIVHNLAGKEGGNARFLLSGFGIGLSWSSLDCYIDTSDIFPLIKTDNYFEDGFQNLD